MGFADTVALGCDDFLNTARRTIFLTVQKVADLTIETSIVGKPELWKHPPPKDYKPGAYKSNWRLNIDAIDDAFDPERTSSFFVSGLDKVPADPFGHRIFISNAAPYAWRIEVENWSTQAPSGVVGPVGLEFKRLAHEAALEAKAGSGGVREL